MPVYFNGKRYITPDRDSHNVTNGWKTIRLVGGNVGREGTYTWDLTRIKS